MISIKEIISFYSRYLIPYLIVMAVLFYPMFYINLLIPKGSNSYSARYRRQRQFERELTDYPLSLSWIVIWIYVTLWIPTALALFLYFNDPTSDKTPTIMLLILLSGPAGSKLLKYYFYD